MMKLIRNTSATQRYNNGDYKAKNNNWHVNDSEWKASQINKMITRNKLQLNTICEIGCGAGEILVQLNLKNRFKDTNFFGYEVSKDAYDLCKKKRKKNIKFFKRDLLKLKTKFDCVLCIDVFEHVENFFGFLRRLRAKGKYKIFHIPLDLSVSSIIRKKLLYNRDTVGHLHYFTPETAIASLKDCGYQIIDIFFTPSYESSSNINLINSLQKIFRKPLYYISPKLLSTLLGGVSLMVLSK